MAELTSAGLTTETFAEILARIEVDQRDAIDAGLDQSTSSPLGQLNRLFARALRLGEESLAAIVIGMDPDTATGSMLGAIAAISGTIREPATASRVAVNITLTPGSYPPGSLVVIPAGRPLDRFANLTTATVSGIYVFAALTAGPIAANANTLVIADAVAGFISVSSHPPATLGRNVETEAELRARRNAEVESPGSSSVGGITADLTRRIPEIENVFITENDTDATRDSIPPHAIEAVVYGPDPATLADDIKVAEQILASKAGGIGTYGTTSVALTDSEGQPHVIRFTRPTIQDLAAYVSVAVLASRYAGDAALAEHIAARAAETLVPGLDVAWSQIVRWALEVDGVLRVLDVSLQGYPFVNVVIPLREKGRLALANISILSTSATP